MHDLRQRGFTLIELLVVIAIIGVLAAMLTANFAGVRSRARDAKRKAEFDQVKKALRLYYNDFQSYPADTGGQISGCGADGTSVCSWGTDPFTARGSQYMGRLPKDSLNLGDNVYEYTQSQAGENFCLVTDLENAGDADAADTQNRCENACAGIVDFDTRPQAYATCAD